MTPLGLILCVLGIAILFAALVLALVFFRGLSKNNKSGADAQSEVKTQGQVFTQVWLIITSLLFLTTSLLCTIPALIATADTTSGELTTLFLIASVLSYPVLSIASIIGSLLLYRSKRFTAARYVSLLPLISVFSFSMAGFIFGR